MSLDLAPVLDSPVGPTTKGPPGWAEVMRLGKLGSQGWNVLAEDLPLPLLVLKQAAVESNLATMQGYCDRRGLLLDPAREDGIQAGPALARRGAEVVRGGVAPDAVRPERLVAASLVAS